MSTTHSTLERRANRTATTALDLALRPVRALAFWLAVLLPFVTAAAVTIGHTAPLPIAALVATNVAALVVGRDHRA